MKLFSKLLVLVALPIVLVGVASTVLVSQLVLDRIIGQQEMAARSTLELHSGLIESFVRTHLARIDTIAATPPVRDGSIAEALAVFADEERRLEGIVEGLYYDELDGTVHGTRGQVFNVEDRPYWPQVLRRETVITGLLESRDTGRPIILIIVPILDSGGNHTAALGATIPVESLLQDVRRIWLGRTGFALLFDASGDVITSGDHASKELIAAIAETLTPGATHAAWIMQATDEFAVTQQPVELVRWQLVLVQSRAELLAELRPVQTAILFITLAAVLLALGLAYVSSRRILAPVGRILDAQRRVSAGDWDVRIDALPADEIGEIGRSFNWMAAQLRDREAQRAEAERALRASEQQLRQAQKMEAIGTLAGGIAHDFNNILNAMLGYTELARDSMSEDDPIREDLDQVLVAGTRASDLVRQILMFSRRSRSEKMPLHVPPLLREALKLMRRSLPANVEIVQRIGERCPAVLADATQIHQVIINLCMNAFQAMEHGGGTLTVELEGLEFSEADANRPPQLAPGTYLCLRVTDTGPGMSKEVIDRVFEPYFTTKKEGRGTGLGLATVHGIVTEHHGVIRVSSESGTGAAFAVYLPAYHGDAAEAHLPKAEGARGGGEHILLVDDDVAVLTVNQRLLESAGYAVTGFGSPIEALDFARGHIGSIDIILTDFNMPGMMGTEFAARIRGLRSDVPVLLVTGLDTEVTRAKAMEVGIRDVVSKPFDMTKIGELIQSILAGGQ